MRTGESDSGDAPAAGQRVPVALLGHPLSTRALNALRRYGIGSWKELEAVDVTELALLPQVGEKTVREIVDAIDNQRLSGPPAAARVEPNDLHLELRTALRGLGERSRAIVIARTIDQPHPTLQELGKRFGITRERVRQLEKKFVGRLKRALGREPQAGFLLRQLKASAPVGAQQLTDAMVSIAGEEVAPAALVLIARVAGYGPTDVSELEKTTSAPEATDSETPRAATNAPGDKEVISIVSGESLPTDFVTIRFASPVPGVDPFDGSDFVSDRHRLAAVWTRQDATETVFIDEEGEILGRWPTRLITSIAWPVFDNGAEDNATNPTECDEPEEAEPPSPHAVGTQEWLTEIRRRHPRAYEPWPIEEDEDLRDEFARGRTLAEIAERHERRPSAIRSRLHKLELD